MMTQLLKNYHNAPNCGAVHKVVDVCQSEIYTGKEDLPSAVTIDDLRICLPNELCSILDSYSSVLCDWEYANFIIENQLWGEKIKISVDQTEEEIIAKFLVIKSPERFGISLEKSQQFVEEL